MPSWLTSTVLHLGLLLLLATGSVLNAPHYGLVDEGGNVVETGTYGGSQAGEAEEALENMPQQDLTAAPEAKAEENVPGPTVPDINSQLAETNLGPMVPDFDLRCPAQARKIPARSGSACRATARGWAT